MLDLVASREEMSKIFEASEHGGVSEGGVRHSIHSWQCQTMCIGNSIFFCDVLPSIMPPLSFWQLSSFLGLILPGCDIFPILNCVISSVFWLCVIYSPFIDSEAHRSVFLLLICCSHLSLSSTLSFYADSCQSWCLGLKWTCTFHLFLRLCLISMLFIYQLVVSDDGCID